MIIDDNLVLWEGEAKNGNGNEIGLTSLKIPGMAESIPLQLRVTENLAGATSVAIKLQQADAKGETYTDIPGAAVTIAAADFKKGKRADWRYLPMSATKQWIRLNVAVTGTATAGKLFCALIREDIQPQQAGTYINAGIIEG